MVGGAIHRPPYTAASSLLIWGIDLWPYVNGKAISLGVDIRKLDAADAVDFLHFLFEEDSWNVASGEVLEAKSKFRETIYRQLYEQEYKYGITGSSRGTQIDPPVFDDEEDIPIPVDPFARSGVTKSFISASLPDETSPLPFGRALDAPLR